MRLILAIIHGEHELEAVSNILIHHSISRVMVLEGTGIGRDSTLKLRSQPSFGFEIWRHLQSERQNAWVLLSVIDENIDFIELVKEVEEITGELSKPHTSIICTIPISYAESLLPFAQK